MPATNVKVTFLSMTENPEALIYAACAVEGCDEKVFCKGLCCRHYQQIKIHGRITSVNRIRKKFDYSNSLKNEDGKYVCSVPGCNKQVSSGGMCSKHLTQVARHGGVVSRTRRDKNQIFELADCAEIVMYDKMGMETARAIIDTCDINKVSEYKWRLGSEGYPTTGIGRKTIRLHTVIMDGMLHVDHIDRNKLNNVRSNLRKSNKKLNAANVGITKRNTTGFKGVIKRGKRFSAQISTNGVLRWLGVFDSPEEAAARYDKEAISLFGEHACTNKSLGLI